MRKQHFAQCLANNVCPINVSYENIDVDGNGKISLIQPNDRLICFWGYITMKK